MTHRQFPKTPLAAIPPQKEPDRPLPTSPKAGPGRRLWHAWLWLTGPRPDFFGPSLAGQERLRRTRLVSVLLVVIAAAIVLVISGAFASPPLWQTALLITLLGVLAALFNRSGNVILGGLLCVAVADAGTIEYILTHSLYGDPKDPGLTSTTVSALHLLILAVMMGGMILPHRLIPIIGAAQVAVILTIFYTVRYDSLLQTEITVHNAGQGYLVIQGPLLTQICGTGIVWLFAWSVERAILRASRAEELSEARARLNEQARQIAEQKQRLEHGIETLQEVQARFANGDYSVRASLQGNELLPLAVSFNIMAERLSRVQQVEAAHRRMENALQQLFDACTAITRGAAPAALETTNTLADRIFPFLKHLSTLLTQTIQIGALMDDLRSILQRQQEHLAQAETQLTSSLALAKTMKEQSGLTIQSEGTGALGARQPELQRTLMNLSILHTQQISLLEQVSKSSTQAHALCVRCIHGTRMLSQRLKEAG